MVNPQAVHFRHQEIYMTQFVKELPRSIYLINKLGMSNRKLDTGGSGLEDGWKHVTGRRRRRYASFFFSHFPDNFDAEAMWGVFAKYGDVKEVVIPNRRNIAGKRFGFVRFWEVTNIKLMERRLDSIIIGATKIHVNTPRFSRAEERHVKRRPAQGDVQVPKAMKETSTRIHNGNFKPAPETCRSYKKALVEGSVEPKADESQKIEIEESVEPWLKNSLVGELRNIELVNSIQECFILEGIQSVRVRYMGDKLVLLTGEEGANVNEIWSQAETWLNETFEAIYPWSPNLTPEQRIIWLRCEGIPLHLWKVQFFQDLIKEVGEVIAVAGETSEFSRLDAARICVRTLVMEPIFVHYKMQIKDRVYNIRIMEELACYGTCRGGCNDYQSSSDESDDSGWLQFDEDGSLPPSPGVPGDGGVKQNREFSQPLREENGPTNEALIEPQFSPRLVGILNENNEQSIREVGPELNDGVVPNSKFPLKGEKTDNDVHFDMNSNDVGPLVIGEVELSLGHKAGGGLNGLDPAVPNLSANQLCCAIPQVSQSDNVRHEDVRTPTRDNTSEFDPLEEGEFRQENSSTKSNSIPAANLYDDLREEYLDMPSVEGAESQGSKFHHSSSNNLSQEVEPDENASCSHLGVVDVQNGDLCVAVSGCGYQSLGHTFSGATRSSCRDAHGRREVRGAVFSLFNSGADSGSRSGSGVLLLRNGEKEAQYLWDLGKSLGLRFAGDDSVIIQKIKEMEVRDTHLNGRAADLQGGGINDVV